MQIGILGLPLTGKSTIFSLLTGTPYDGSFRTDAIERIAKVRDERIDTLSKMYEPNKTTYATVNFVDIPSFDTGADPKEKRRILQMIQNVEAVLLVIRAFENTNVPFPENCEKPLSQLELLRTELIIRDLEVVENRLIRIDNEKKKKKATPDMEKEEKLLFEIKAELEEGNFASRVEADEEIKKLISSLSLFTLRPIIVLVNVDDKQFADKKYLHSDEIIKECEKQHFAYIEISGKLESELVELPDDEKLVFMEDLGIEKPGIDRLSKVVYDHLGLISFFTVGKDEVRAWTIEKGFTMKKAAGRIHSDLEKGFIKAETMTVKDLLELGSEEAVKAAGLWKLSGKEEIVNDGDILNIRANA